MSGSSLDGLDIAFCRFTQQENTWRYSIEKAETISYPNYWIEQLGKAHLLPSNRLLQLDIEYGKFLGQVVHSFISQHNLFPELISSHGHTIFHEPENGFSFQLGRGSRIALTTQITTTSDFRNTDILNGGQGAPLVPIGDELLFGEYSACINLGGIANISYRINEQRVGYDICGANQLLNALSQELGLNFDKDGIIASKGIVNRELLRQLNSDTYFQKAIPKSLSNEYVRNHFTEAVKRFSDSTANKLATVIHHISEQISQVVSHIGPEKILITGGGAHNQFLVETLRKATNQQVVIPRRDLVDFKEALIFAFMGVLRVRNQPNCLASVTGARINSIAGSINQP